MVLIMLIKSKSKIRLFFTINRIYKYKIEIWLYIKSDMAVACLSRKYVDMN